MISYHDRIMMTATPMKSYPFLFDMYKILENNLNNFGNDKYLIQTCSQAKSSGIKLLEVHGVEKSLDPNLRPEKQHTFPKQGKLERLQIGQGRARSKRKKPDPINQAINQPSNLSQEIPGRTKIETRKTNSIHSTNGANDRLVNNSPFMPDVPFHPDPLHRPPKQQPIKQNITQNIQEINPSLILILILKKTHHFKKASCQRHSKDWTGHFFQNPKELGELINKENFVYKYLPKQTDIDKILEVIQRKVLRGTYLPMEVKEIQAGYLCSPYFKDLYLYLLQNKLPSSKSAIRKLETLAEKYVLLDCIIIQNITRKRDSGSSNTRDVCRQNYNIIS